MRDVFGLAGGCFFALLALAMMPWTWEWWVALSASGALFVASGADLVWRGVWGKSRLRKVAPGSSRSPSVEWRSAPEAIESLTNPALVSARDKFKDDFERAYIEGKDAEDRIRAIDDAHPSLNTAPPEVVSERDRQHRRMVARSKASDYAQQDLRDAWDALRNNIEGQLQSGALIAKGFRAPHVGGNPEVNIAAAEWRILTLENVKSEALRKDSGETVYVGIVIGRPNA